MFDGMMDEHDENGNEALPERSDFPDGLMGDIDFLRARHPNPPAPEPLSPSPELPPSHPMRQFIRGMNREQLEAYALGAFASKISTEQMLWHTEDALRAARTTTRAPEIRYQLRNWHHVTCLVAGGACTCLAQREALIAELAAERPSSGGVVGPLYSGD